MVHALLTATPEYAKANHELMLLDMGQMSPRVHLCYYLTFVQVLQPQTMFTTVHTAMASFIAERQAPWKV